MNTDDAVRKAVRVWMRDVLQQKGWSASQWARLAGTSATNITRVLNHVNKIIPNAETISKLSRVAGSQPNLSAYVQNLTLPSLSLYVMNAQMLHRLQSSKAIWRGVMDGSLEARRTIVPADVQEPAFVFEIQGLELDLREIRPGDQLVIERCQREDLSQGDVAIAIHVQSGSVVAGEFYPPVLMPRSSDRGLAPVPLAQLDIIGRASRHVRKL